MTEPNILLRYAEDQFLHGHMLSPWIVDYVDLEVSLAVGSIAQEEFAHAATLLELADQDNVNRDQFIYERPLGEWWPSQLLAAEDRDWPSAVLRGVLVASAGLLLSQELVEMGDEQVQIAAMTMLNEQRLHHRYWVSWIRLLGNDDRTRNEFGKRGDDLLPLARDLLGAAPGMPAEPARQRLYNSWLEDLGPLLDSAGLNVELLGTAPESRIDGSRQEQLARTLRIVRALRVGPDDGVRAVYQ